MMVGLARQKLLVLFFISRETELPLISVVRLDVDPRGSGVPEPLFHLVVPYQARLLHHHAATEKHDKVGDPTDIETPSQLGVFFRIHFYHHRLASHVRGRAQNFRGGSVAWPAPLRPEIHEHRNANTLNDFVE